MSGSRWLGGWKLEVGGWEIGRLAIGRLGDWEIGRLEIGSWEFGVWSWMLGFGIWDLHFGSWELGVACKYSWLVFATGVAWDVLYHAPIILWGAQWPAAIDTIGEFGHVITFVGIVMVIFAVLRTHSKSQHKL